MSNDDSDVFVRRLTAALDSHATADTVGADSPDDGDAAPDDALTAAVVAELRAPSTWTGPPADLRDAILSAAAEQAAQAAAPSVPSAPSVGPRRHDETPDAADRPAAPVVPLQRRAPTWQRLSVLVPAAAVAAAIFAYAVLTVNDIVTRPDRGTTYVATGTDLAPRADAEVSVASAAAGFSVVIDARDLPAAAPGSYYAAYLSGPRGIVPLGSFHGRRSGSPITMWSGVDPKDYPTFTVTLQREGAPPGPSDQVVLRATLFP